MTNTLISRNPKDSISYGYLVEKLESYISYSQNGDPYFSHFICHYVQNDSFSVLVYRRLGISFRLGTVEGYLHDLGITDIFMLCHTSALVNTFRRAWVQALIFEFRKFPANAIFNPLDDTYMIHGKFYPETCEVVYIAKDFK